MESFIAHGEHCKAVWDVVCFTALCWKCSGEHFEVSQLPLALTHRPPTCVVTAASVTIQTGKASKRSLRMVTVATVHLCVPQIVSVSKFTVSADR